MVASCNVVFRYAGELVEVEFAVGQEPPGGPEGWGRVPVGAEVLWVRSAAGHRVRSARAVSPTAADATIWCPILEREVVCRYDLALAAVPPPPGLTPIVFGGWRLAYLIVLPAPAVVGDAERVAV